jgi:hypothetical protein
VMVAVTVPEQIFRQFHYLKQVRLNLKQRRIHILKDKGSVSKFTSLQDEQRSQGVMWRVWGRNKYVYRITVEKSHGNIQVASPVQ